MTSTSDPLCATLAQLQAVDPSFGADIGRPEGDGWFRFDALDARVPAWIDDLAARHGGHRDVAGSFAGSRLAGAAVTVPVAAIVLTRRLPDPTGPLRIHRHDEGHFDRVAFERPHLLVTPGDVLAGHPDVTVVDHAEMIDTLGTAVSALLGPLIGTVRAHAPFGTRGLWAGVADEIASTALWAARATGTPGADAWAVATKIIDAVRAEAPALRSHPRPFPVPTEDGDVLFSVRSTCCLYYKTTSGPRDPDGDSYCTTCPLRHDTSRRERLVKFLDDERSATTDG